MKICALPRFNRNSVPLYSTSTFMFQGNFHKPFIVIGMHRSGTSLVTKLLHEAGVNMGEEREHNEESLPFLNVNEQVMKANGKTWLEPGSRFHPTCPESAMSMYVNHFKLNLDKYSLFGRPRGSLIKILHDVPWGFKDPRTSFTLQMWLDLFPKAKVIHVVRNPRPVVASLMNRNKIEGEVYDARLDNAQFCLDLWRQYVSTCMEQLAHIPDSNKLTIKYEELTQEPAGSVKLGRFIGRDVNDSSKNIIRQQSTQSDLDINLSNVTHLLSKFGYED